MCGSCAELPSVSWLQPALCPPPYALTRAQAFESSVHHSGPWSPPHPDHVQGEKPDPSTFQPKLMGCVCTPGFSLSLCYLVLCTLHVTHLPFFLGQSPHFIILLGTLCDSMPHMSCGLYNAYITSIISCLLSSS